MLVLKNDTKRESGRKVQLGNIKAAKTISDVIRTCLGPRAMLKMLMDPMGGIVMTNDGNAILREIQVQHPAAKSMIEISRTQDEEVGDGTTSVIVLAGELLKVAEPFLVENMHPTVIIAAYRQALEDAVDIMRNQIAKPVNTSNDDEMIQIIKSGLGTKFMKGWNDLACQIALDAVKCVHIDDKGHKEIDIKRYAKVEKVPGGCIDDSEILDGVMFNKDVTHTGMRRKIVNPRIVMLDSNLEYKKGESQTNMEFMQETDFRKILELEEDYIKNICDDIIALKPDIVLTEKGVSDLAQHYLLKANITALRRLRKSDMNRVARAVGGQIVHRPEELKESDVGTQCGLFEIKKLGDEYFTFLTKCEKPKACTILLRGASKDVLMEVERNLQDAMNVARNVILDPFLVPGGGAVEAALAHKLNEKSKEIAGVGQWPYRALSDALKIIPKTLMQNCGVNTIRTMTTLIAKHATGGTNWGVDGESGAIVDMEKFGVWDTLQVKSQVMKTAIETAILLLRIDDIVSGVKKQSDIDAEKMAGRFQSSNPEGPPEE